MRKELQAILNLEVPVIVEIGRTRLPTKAVMALSPGKIIELPKSADDELEMLVNNKTVGTGIAVKIGENFGLQVSYIGNVRERLEALASGEAVAGTPSPKPEPEPAKDADAEPASEDAEPLSASEDESEAQPRSDAA